MRRILLIDDDRLQLALTRAQFSQFRVERFELDYSATYEDGLARLLEGGYAACLLDYQLGAKDGLELLREAVARGCRTPLIFLTAETSDNVDTAAMNAGALDYLVKGEINPAALERSIRYALKLGDTLEQLHRLATRDALTALLNRREFDRLLAEEAERAKRFGRPLALVLLDLDRFKTVNDTHGHPAGDAVLRATADRLAAELRVVDRFARFGGEEFAVLLPETPPAGALDMATRLVAAMGRAPIVLPDGTALTQTVSAGAASLPMHAADAAGLVSAADRALYAAKHAGRARAVTA
ncbi:MAG: GGDEF domain-containing response regulator [Verrucomicrobiota bacterium]